MPADLPTVFCASAAKWEAWLDEHHGGAPGVWLKIAKAGSGVASVTIGEALDVAICFGWIDGQRAGHDDEHYLQKYTPRTRRSRWSKLNRDRAVRLIDEGRMRPAGLAEVQRAQADGRWDDAYDSPSTITVPDDLQRALDANPAALACFGTLNSLNRYAVLYGIQNAKRPETRVRRIEKFVTMLAEGRKPYP